MHFGRCTWTRVESAGVHRVDSGQRAAAREVSASILMQCEAAGAGLLKQSSFLGIWASPDLGCSRKPPRKACEWWAMAALMF